MKAIQDQFTHFKISRQRKWQLRKETEDRCRYCGKSVVAAGRCAKHYKAEIEYQRKKRGYKGRVTKSLLAP